MNQRYPVYFPELRPFFLENANYFSTPISLLYTRNIIHPEFGARLTGKLGHTNLGLLVIDDRTPGEVYAQSDPLYGKHAVFAVGRGSVDLGKGSNLGVIYTDEEFAGSANRVGGLDYTARFNNHWTSTGQSVESSTKNLAAAGARQSYSAGPASYLDFNRSGHSFNFDDNFRDFSNGFVTQVGFIQNTNIRANGTHANQNSLQAFVTIQPFRSLTVDHIYLLDRDHSAANGALVFENQTSRAKINYQFTRAFSARVIAEYDSLHANPAETSLVRTKQVSTSALLTWLPILAPRFISATTMICRTSIATFAPASQTARATRRIWLPHAALNTSMTVARSSSKLRTSSVSNQPQAFSFYVSGVHHHLQTFAKFPSSLGGSSS